MKIIVGLGNPGKEYEGTRHNAGKFFLEKITKHFKNKKGISFIFPDQFMNNSGPTLKKALKELDLKPKLENTLVIHDDLDIEVGRVKLTFAKSSGGHKGVESIIKALRSDKFWRLRIGIAPKRKTKKDSKDFLLSQFSPTEKKLVAKNLKKIVIGAETWLKNPDKAMNIVNRK